MNLNVRKELMYRQILGSGSKHYFSNESRTVMLCFAFLKILLYVVNIFLE